jgi:hypothetical protein
LKSELGPQVSGSQTLVGPVVGIHRGFSAVGDNRVRTQREEITSEPLGPKREFES